MKTPKIKKIKIGSSWYDVEYVNGLKDEQNRELFGRIFQGLRLIKISKKCSYQTMLQTLQHEGTHGIVWEYGIDDAEELVEPISNGFFAFIIDNPELVREILRHAEKIKK